MLRYSLAALLALPFGLAGPGQVAADELPRIEGNFIHELRLDDRYRTPPADPRFTNLYSEAELGLDVELAPWFGLHSLFKLEQVRPVSTDSVFRHQGVYVEELYASFGFGGFEVIAGKFTPNFGIAWHLAPGVYGTDLAETYEFAEQIGGGLSYTVDTQGFGEHAVSASTFFADRSALNRRALTSTQPRRTTLSSGGPGNTRGFESYQFGLDGSDVAGIEGLSYHLAGISFGKGANTPARMRGLVAGVSYDAPLAMIGDAELVATPIVEWAEFRNYDGDTDRRASFLTTGLRLAWDGFNVSVSRTGANDREPGVARDHDRFVQLSAGYAWELGPAAMGFDVGHLWSREAAENARTWGAIFSTAFTF